MKKSIRSRVKQLFGYLIGAVALFYVVSQGQWQESLNTLGEISTYTLILMLVFTISGWLFQFLMSYVFIRLEIPIEFRAAAEINLIINFINQLLPSRFAGTAATPLVISQRTGLEMGTSIGIAGINTALYAIIYGIVSGFGLVLLFNNSPKSILGIIGFSTLLYLIVGMTILISGYNPTFINAFLKRLVPIFDALPIINKVAVTVFERIPEFTEQSATVFQKTFDSPLMICLYVIGWVGSRALFPALRVTTLFYVFGTPLTPLATLPIILIAAYSVTLLPLTPGGIGVTEATAVAVFVSLGIPHEIASATILVDRVLGVYFPALLGWYPTIRENPLTLKTD